MTRAADPADLDARFVPVPRGDLAAEELDGELVLLDEATGAVHVLNPTATLVWRCLDGDADVATLAAELADVVDAEAATVRRDVLALVRRLAGDGLLAGFEPEPAPRAGEPSAGDSERGAPRFLTPPPT